MKFHGAEIHCAAVFCAAECELCVRHSALLKCIAIELNLIAAAALNFEIAFAFSTARRYH
ncbi:hypothetical protein [uncultured Campylobacter sp.]|uniref:hypothetical protein n=1 Tax=uncultured Campylobacter sp. TaxID=218934 RepID=UPI00261FF5BA|nr:hypothetical protein [uncultured Campylobacter sp.]